MGSVVGGLYAMGCRAIVLPYCKMANWEEHWRTRFAKKCDVEEKQEFLMFGQGNFKRNKSKSEDFLDQNFAIYSATNLTFRVIILTILTSYPSPFSPLPQMCSKKKLVGS
jgi:hypothetical protein